MASIPLTLAALATSAVPGLEVTGAREYSFGSDGAYTSALLQTDEQEVIVRVPVHSAAEVQQSAEMLGLAALAQGARSTLPFEVPVVLGLTRAGDTRAVVSTFLPGGRITAEDLTDDAILLQPIAEAIAAIHRLPTSLVQQAGLPVRTAEETRQAAARLVERAAETRLLPDTVHGRWLGALGSGRFWDFAPTVVHGSFDAEQLLIDDDTVVGVLGWDELSVGDPAMDLSWLQAAGHDVLELVIARYTEQNGSGTRTELEARASFYHELELAKWLLHGVDTHDDAIVSDAVSMLDRLVDRLGGMSNPVPSRTVVSVTQASQMLDETPEIPEDARTETAEYESLDEDRMFSGGDGFADTDAIDRAPSDSGEYGDDLGEDLADTNVIERLRADPAPGAVEGDSDLHDATQDNGETDDTGRESRR